MKQRFLSIFAVLVVLAFGSGFFLNGGSFVSVESTSASDDHHHETLSSDGVGLGNWVVTKTDVNELAGLADLVVRVRAVSQNERIVKHDLPVSAVKNGDSETSIEDYKVLEPEYVEGRNVTTPFTDTTLEVLEVYKGDSEKKISVTQFGGGEGANLNSLAEDPLYVIGSEHILFLTEDYNEKGQKVYSIINPSARYEVEGNTLIPNSNELVTENSVLTIDQLVSSLNK